MQISTIGNRTLYCFRLLVQEAKGRSSSQIMRVMRLTALILFIGCLHLSANTLSQTVTLSGTNLKLVEVLTAVKNQTGFRVLYNEEVLLKSKTVSVSEVNMPLKDFLNKIFKDQPLKYVIKNNSIFISQKVASISIEEIKSSEGILAPPGDVKGRVMNENGEPLAGANITVKETNQGSITDNNGYYKIGNVAAGQYTLVASFVGYATKSAIIKLVENGTTVLDFILKTSLVNLDQITVASTLSSRKIRSVPTTMAVLTQADLKNRNLNNIADVLISIPGIVIQPGTEGYNSGSSRNPQLMIRGTQGNVKYIVDGVETVPGDYITGLLQTMDPNTIEKIEVLKGPMASTLYGSGAGGGIIAITTKKGKGGKTKVNFKTMFTDRKNDYADYKGYEQNYSLNVSGGSEQFNYLIGAGYNLYPTTKLTDINNGIDDKTWSYTTKIGGKFNTIKADLSLQYGKKNYGAGSTGISDNKFYESIGLSTYPVPPLIDIRTSQRSFTTALHLTHSITENWYQDLTVGYDIQNFDNSTYSDPYGLGTYSYYEFLFSKMNVRYFMFYDHPWSAALKTSITAGFEYVGYETHNMSLASTTTLTNFFAISTPASLGAASFTKAPYSSAGYFAEAVTGLNNNLFLTTGIRFDVNNAYGDNIKGYAQPRVGLSYIIESGAFKMKPKVVWGVSSDAPDPTYKISYVQSDSYSTTFYVGNPDIKPTRSEGYELGADIFYGSNYSLNLTYYDQRLKDMIITSYINDYTTNPPSATVYHYNIARVINRGLEVSAKAVFEPFTIDLSYNQSINKWGKDIGQAPTAQVYPGAPLSNIPKRSAFARLTYKIPSFLSWTKKGGSINIDWRYNGSSYNYDFIKYSKDFKKYSADPANNPLPNFDDYYLWMKAYSYFNLRADYSVTNYAVLYLDVQNLLNKHGSANGQLYSQFPGRRINFGFNINF